MSATLDDLTQQARDVALQVHAAQEQSDDRERVVAAHQGVDALSVRYREVCATLNEADKMRIERTVGRRITDLRRLASLLPRVGTFGSSTPDRQVTGASQVGERRITGVSWRGFDRREAPDTTPHVGGEIDAWCGPCEGMTTHKIIALVGDTPKQVVCDACGGRHGYRTTPARKAASPEAEAVRAPVQETEAVRKAEKKAEELRALGRELAEVENAIPFDPKRRYRAGEVISHPEFGRGKVETVLRASMLVRFSTGGLKSVMLF